MKVSDNEVGTFYEVIPGDESCWLGYDFGKKTTAYISKIIYQPQLDKTLLNRYNGIKFYGSNDLTTWDYFFTID